MLRRSNGKINAKTQRFLLFLLFIFSYSDFQMHIKNVMIKKLLLYKIATVIFGTERAPECIKIKLRT